ncbi:signal peptidase I [Henriciella sp.]|uniref:signal peptidase I n=1 Tax=Henriciella sp. TaxID=1968823 RepID=UPI002628784D|nr:signal peptidase I [Henriciella sp.]
MSESSTPSEKPSEKRSLKAKILHEIREWVVTLAIFIPAFYIFSFLIYEQRVIPSESMVPNLQVGDRVAVNKFSYGYSRYSLPWGAWRLFPEGDGRLFGSEPDRGDVAVFMHPHTDRVMIKRILGLPGDRVQMIDEQLYLNGQPVEREFIRRIDYVPHEARYSEAAREYRETINGKSWLTHQWQQGAGQTRSLDTTPVFEVPEGNYLFVGDNRDNSEDGRSTTGHCPPNGQGVIDRTGCELPRGISAETASVGFVPAENLIGRADTVLFSTYSCDSAQAEPCMKKRLWRGL